MSERLVGRLGAVVLAAGRSSRMGRDKALLPIGDETFVSRIARILAAAGADPVIVVTTRDRFDEIATSVREAARAVVNPWPERGQLSSLQCGLRALPPETAAALVMPVDLPFIRGRTVAALVDTWRDHSCDVARPVHAGRHGHPVLVTRRVMTALLEAGGDRTARMVIGAFPGTTRDVPVSDEGALADIDTPDDYAALLGKWKDEERMERNRQ